MSIKGEYSGEILPEQYMMMLRKAVEEKTAFRVMTSKDFDKLSEVIVESGAGYVSTSTLKRIWGYVKGTPGRHSSTLDILARFIGYADSAEFFEFCKAQDESESGYKSGRILNVPELTSGVRLCLSWMPDRELVIRYEGENTFFVEEARNTKLAKGGKVRMLRIVEGEPLVMDVLDEEGKVRSVYEAGKVNGVMFKIID